MGSLTLPEDRMQFSLPTLREVQVRVLSRTSRLIIATRNDNILQLPSIPD